MTPEKIKRILKSIEELIVSEDYKSAKKYLLKVLSFDKNNPEAHYYLGEVYCKLRDFKKSIYQIEIANKLLPKNPQIIHLLGWANFMDGNIETGRILMEKALKMTPYEVRSLCDLAVLEMKALNEKAIEYAQKALELAPNDPMSREVFLVTHTFFERIKELKRPSKKQDLTFKQRS